MFKIGKRLKFFLFILLIIPFCFVRYYLDVANCTPVKLKGSNFTGSGENRIYLKYFILDNGKTGYTSLRVGGDYSKIKEVADIIGIKSWCYSFSDDIQI